MVLSISRQKFLIATVIPFILALNLVFTVNLCSCTTTSLTVEGRDGTLTLNLTDLVLMSSVDGYGCFQNRFGNWRGQGNYTGVLVSSLVELVGGMSPGDTVTVYAEDGYNQTYCYQNIYNTWPNASVQGDMILAYTYNETTVPTWTDGLRIAFLPPDGSYSNIDRNETSCLGQKGSSAGARWVKNVDRIVVEYASWTVTIFRGEYNITYGNQQITKLPSITAPGAYNKTTGEVVGPYNYTGVEVSYLLQSVNGIGSNESLLVTARDGYNMTYTYEQVMGDENVTMILAYMRDSEELPPTKIPRIAFVGPNSPMTPGHFWTKQVSSMKIQLAVEEYTLHLLGAIDIDIDRASFESGVNCHAVTYNDAGRIYKGIALWRFCGLVDDSAPEGAHDFRDDLNYTVTVVASDGYNKTFSFSTVARNDSIIVANTVNGGPITGMYPPLKLVGKLRGSQKIKGVSMILLNDITPPVIENVSQQPTENNVYPDDKVMVYANVTDDMKGIKKVILNYTTSNGTWFTVEMTNLEGNVYNATIPQFPYGTNVTYIVIAEDNDNNTITTEQMGYEFQYGVIPEFPSMIILLLFMAATLLAVIVCKRKHSDVDCVS